MTIKTIVNECNQIRVKQLARGREGGKEKFRRNNFDYPPAPCFKPPETPMAITNKIGELKQGFGFDPSVLSNPSRQNIFFSSTFALSADLAATSDNIVTSNHAAKFLCSTNNKSGEVEQ